jgi:Outer membrane protein
MKGLVTLLISLSIFSLTAFAKEQTKVLSLDEAIEIALEKNPELQAKSASVDSIKAGVRDIKANFYPQLEFRFILPFVERESGIFADQLIWDFGRTQNLVRASRANLESTEFERAATREDVILNTKIAYYTALTEKRLVEAAEKSASESEKRLEQAEGFLRAGRISNIEATRAEVNLGNNKLNLINARNSLQIAMMRLATVMGLEEEFDYQLKDELEYREVNIDLENAVNTALEQRPELNSLRAREVGVRAELEASKKDLYFPIVLGRAAYRFEGEGATGPDFIAGIGIQFDIFQGFSDLADVNQARANLRRSQSELESLKQQIEFQVKQLYLNLKSAEESIKVTKTSKLSAGKNVELARERYRLGVGSQVELAEAESLLASTLANHVQAIYNYKIALAQLERAMGEDIAEE